MLAYRFKGGKKLYTLGGIKVAAKYRHHSRDREIEVFELIPYKTISLLGLLNVD